MSNIITIFDTSYGSLNLGDFIIMEAINNLLDNIIENPKVYLVRVPTHMNISKNYYEILKKSKLKILCGTNLFHLYYMPFSKFNPWKINFTQLNTLRNTLLFGVGTSILNDSISFKRIIRNIVKIPYSEFMWKKLLIKDSNLYHSVRDTESVNILKELKFNNVLNTGCPTLWRLDEDHCSHIPTHKGKSVVVTFTDYNKQLSKDKKILKMIGKYYKEIYIWSQGSEDYKYIMELLDLTRINARILPATLKSFDEVLLVNDNIDYIGTRLHGGIRALQHKKRSIIIAVDNRALSFGRDFNLPIIDRNDIEELEEKINTQFQINIKLNKEAIELFKNSLRIYVNS